MDFFEEQDRARRNTARLILLLVAAVVSLVLVSSAAVLWAFPSARYDPLFVVSRVGGLVIAVVLIGWAYKAFQLRHGGHAVANRLGGRPIVSPETLAEKRVIAVVEEMAIAAGMPVPSVYVLDDDAINAFAAGRSSGDAVIGVTRGAIEYLSRDELQGVIAHEFSHIFHGDMRLNMHLISVLHGILLLGLIGRVLADGGRHASLPTSRRSDSKDNPAAFILLLGIGLIVVGYAGTLCGHLIKAAVSRQREYLADASAVRYTRNADGILGALKRIGGFAGSVLRSRHTAEYSHLYFSNGVPMRFGGWLDTHPALEERIRRLEPGWDGSLDDYRRGHGMLPPSSLAPGFTGLAAAVENVGQPDGLQLEAARETLSGLPETLTSAAHHLEGAQALLYGVLLGANAEHRQHRRARLATHVDGSLLTWLDRLEPALSGLDTLQRLPLLEMTFPALRQMEPYARQKLAATLRTVVIDDGDVGLLDWTLLRILERNLGRRQRLPRHLLSLTALEPEVAVVLAALARKGNHRNTSAEGAFQDGWTVLPYPTRSLKGSDALDIRELDRAAQRLERLKPLDKPRLLKAMARCIEHDGQVNASEAELFRAIADMLDCPMPPLQVPLAHVPTKRTTTA
ncbi:M48 family metallopeptidase [Pseudomonas sp. Marseille-QA0892]